MTRFVRNWLQNDLWQKGFTFATTTYHSLLGEGRMCLNCGAFQPGDNSDENWICPECNFQHLLGGWKRRAQ